MRTCRELEGLTIYTDELSYSLGAIKDICFLAGGSCGGYVLDGKKKDCAFIPFSAGDKLTDKGLYVSCQKGIRDRYHRPILFLFEIKKENDPYARW
ncbi:hypothetical protein V6B65_11205 [Bacillus altitudinis]